MGNTHLEPLLGVPERLRLLADWFDGRDRISGNPDDQIQADLRRLASEITQQTARLALAEEVWQAWEIYQNVPFGSPETRNQLIEALATVAHRFGEWRKARDADEVTGD